MQRIPTDYWLWYLMPKKHFQYYSLNLRKVLLPKVACFFSFLQIQNKIKLNLQYKEGTLSAEMENIWNAFK